MQAFFESNTPLLRPTWAAPNGVDSAMSLRQGGVSTAHFNSLNLSFGVGDEAPAVLENRSRFGQALGVQPLWMRQVHGAHVHRWTSASDLQALPTADAAWTSEARLACTVGAADCMPVFFALADGSAVGAAHAGWRGLAAGVLQATINALCSGMGAKPDDCVVWLGPRLSQPHFEVRADVLAAFGVGDLKGPTPGFAPAPHREGHARWWCDLAYLARQRLEAAGVQHITDCGLCTASQPSDFFSFRRDGVTGRHAAAIWRR